MSCVPLRLTAISATEDMPVFVWIAGKTRAVPQNFVHVTPDLSALPWTKCANSNYFGGGFFPGAAALFNPFGFGSQQCQTEYKELLKATAKQFGAGKWMTTEFAGERSKELLDAIWNTASPQGGPSREEEKKTIAAFFQLITPCHHSQRPTVVADHQRGRFLAPSEQCVVFRRFRRCPASQTRFGGPISC